jgi:predicted alpha-1,2-mannosidase
LAEYITKGYISTPDVRNANVETKARAGVSKTLEYAYDDYALALLAAELNDGSNHDLLMGRSGNYTNLFDSSTGLMRGRLENGEWVADFNPQYPYYEYMYREANAWQASFFVPHDPKGLAGLYKSEKALETQLDTMFSMPWNPAYIARNISGFIGQYCHGNQPGRNAPYMYYFAGQQPKAQKILDEAMSRFYGMGEEGLALCGMDDCGEMSAWYVFNAMGLYPFSPADPKYIVTVPLFDRVEMRLGSSQVCQIVKQGSGSRILKVESGGQTIDGWFVSHRDLVTDKPLTVWVD